MPPLVTAFMVAAVVVTAAAVARRSFRVIKVTGRSMLPTYRPGDRVLVRRVTAGELRVDDVVVVERPDADGRWAGGPGGPAQREWMIKRLAALPGDPVSPGLIPDGRSGCVPAGKVIVLGDAGPGSRDSKQLGYVPLARVLGVAVRPRTGLPAVGPPRDTGRQ